VSHGSAIEAAGAGERETASLGPRRESPCAAAREAWEWPAEGPRWRGGPPERST